MQALRSKSRASRDLRSGLIVLRPAIARPTSDHQPGATARCLATASFAGPAGRWKPTIISASAITIHASPAAKQKSIYTPESAICRRTRAAAQQKPSHACLSAEAGAVHASPAVEPKPIFALDCTDSGRASTAAWRKSVPVHSGTTGSH